MAVVLQPPADQFGVYSPTADRPFDDRRVGHLLRRAGFGPTTEWLKQFSGQSPAAALDWLFNFSLDEDPMNDKLEELQGLVTFQKAEMLPILQEWCLFRMVYTPRPLQEKMALFWHNHFATSAAKVDQINYMQKQIELFRKQGLGSFRELLVSVTHDQAMLVWLDGRLNKKGKANENYAREIMELFALGVGNYTEKDVQELARAFTGIGDNGKINPNQFDKGDKTVFGKTGPLDAEGAVDLILAQPAAPKHLAHKLLKEFVHPHPTDEQVNHYADRLLATKWDLKTTLREMLSSNMFFSDWAYRAKIKSPIELVVGATVAVGGKANMPFLRDSTTKMGQEILFPPNVKGWDGEETWINSNTILLRFNFGLSLSTQRGSEFVKKSQIENGLLAANATTGDQAVDYFGRLLLDGNIKPKLKQELIEYMKVADKGKTVTFELKIDKPNEKIRGLMHLLMSSPEYQLA